MLVNKQFLYLLFVASYHNPSRDGNILIIHDSCQLDNFVVGVKLSTDFLDISVDMSGLTAGAGWLFISHACGCLRTCFSLFGCHRTEPKYPKGFVRVSCLQY